MDIKVLVLVLVLVLEPQSLGLGLGLGEASLESKPGYYRTFVGPQRRTDEGKCCESRYCNNVFHTVAVCIAVLTAVKSSVPTLTHVMRSQGGNKVYAVTSLDDDVFVMRHNSQQVEVYDAMTFRFHRHIAVPGLCSSTYGMTACAKHMCLYLSDSDKDSSVHRVELSGSNAVKKWSVAKGPIGLSVNVAHNLVVACRDANKIQEYTTHGSLVREICLQAGVTNPWHAIQLSTGDYVVSQCTSPGVVSVVGVGGQVVHSYWQSETSHVGQMKCPASLAVTKNNNILVADQNNNRILSVNRSTDCVQELTLSVDGGIQRPCVLCLDESRGRLYVGEWGEWPLSTRCRVLVFDGVRL